MHNIVSTRTDMYTKCIVLHNNIKGLCAFLHNIEFQHPAITVSDSIQCIHTVMSQSSWTPFSFWYLEVEVGEIFKIDKMSKPISPREELNAQYKERIPMLPEDINHKMTNLLLALQVTCLPMKVLIILKTTC